MYPRICIQPSISSGRPQPVLWSSIELAMKQPALQAICDQIKLLDGRDPEELARLKRQLPIITPHACRFNGDGSRKSANAIPSGLVMLDIDHIDDPRDFFSTHIFPVLNPAATSQALEVPTSSSSSSRPGEFLSHTRSNDLLRRTIGAEVVDVVVNKENTLSSNKNTPLVVNIYFVAITPSGHGLRIIAERLPGESIPDAQQRIASACRISEYDGVTTDLARASYLMPWSYVLYCEASGLDFKDESHQQSVTNYCTIALLQENMSPSTSQALEVPTSSPSSSRPRELIRAEVVDIVVKKNTPVVVGSRTSADVEQELTQLLLQTQNNHEEIILDISDYRPGTDYGYDHPCPPELQKP